MLLSTSRLLVMLTPSGLLDALVQSCRGVLPEGTTLLKSGDPADSSLSPTWLEFWIDRVGSPVARRNAAASQVDVSFTVNCFGRPPATPGQVQTLAEAVRQHITALRLPISQDALPVGMVMLQEAEMRDLSRPATQKTASLSQWSISVRGTLHTCPLTH